jgi:hypothetical protein
MTEKKEKEPSKPFDLVKWLKDHSASLEFTDTGYARIKFDGIVFTRKDPIESVKAIEEYHRLLETAKEFRQKAEQAERAAQEIQSQIE